MTNKGYTLLYAVLLSSVAMIIGVSILVIEKKEIQLTESAASSMQAIYAADSGIECVQYLDSLYDTAVTPNRKKLATSTAPNVAEMSCNGLTPGYIDFNKTSNVANYIFQKSSTNNALYPFILGPNTADTSSPCFEVEYIKKETTNAWVTTVTMVRVNGYNTCNADDPRRVQRSLEITY